MPELKRNILLNFEYGINFKYEGMLSHSFNRFYVVTKFSLQTIDDIKIPPITFDMECSYLNIQLDQNTHAVKHLPNIQNFSSKIIPFIYYYKNQVHSYDQRLYNILTKDIPLILSTFKNNKKEKRGIITSLVTGFIGLAFEEISSYLHNKRQKAQLKAFDTIQRTVNLERNKIFHLEDSMIRDGIYNAKQ